MDDDRPHDQDGRPVGPNANKEQPPDGTAADGDDPSDAAAPLAPGDIAEQSDLKRIEVECYQSGEIFVTSHWLVKVQAGRPVRFARTRTTEHRDAGQALAVIARALTGPVELKLVADNAARDPSAGATQENGPALAGAAPGPPDAPDRVVADPAAVLVDIWQTMAGDPEGLETADMQAIFAAHGYAEARPATAADVAASPWPLEVWEDIFALTPAGEDVLYPSATRRRGRTRGPLRDPTDEPGPGPQAG